MQVELPKLLSTLVQFTLAYNSCNHSQIKLEIIHANSSIQLL